MGTQLSTIHDPKTRALYEAAAGLANAAAVPMLTSDTGSPTVADTRSEKLLSADVQRWLRGAGYLFLVQRGDRPSSGAKGWPDITVLLGSKVCLLELKNARGKLSPWQKEFHARAGIKGTPCFTVRSLSHAIECVRAVEKRLS